MLSPPPNLDIVEPINQSLKHTGTGTAMPNHESVHLPASPGKANTFPIQIIGGFHDSICSTLHLLVYTVPSLPELTWTRKGWENLSKVGIAATGSEYTICMSLVIDLGMIHSSRSQSISSGI